VQISSKVSKAYSIPSPASNIAATCFLVISKEVCAEVTPDLCSSLSKSFPCVDRGSHLCFPALSRSCQKLNISTPRHHDDILRTCHCGSLWFLCFGSVSYLKLSILYIAQNIFIMRESTKGMMRLMLHSLRFRLRIYDLPKRFGQGRKSPSSSPRRPGSRRYIPHGPSNPLVKPLSSRRKRALSITHEAGMEADQITFSQSQSPLFAKLPAEIRLLIWEYTLCYGHIHIRPNLKERKLEHMKCKEPSHTWRNCWQVFDWNHYTKVGFYEYGFRDIKSLMGVSPASEGLLALPLTCRRM
jgi:hypothetical protein